MNTVTLVIPVLNESCAINENLDKIQRILSTIDRVECSILVIDDGSSDDTANMVKAFCSQNQNSEFLCLNRNFGKEAAICAGLEYIDSDAAIVMDSDLQHPPELIPKMITLWQSGIEVVEACKSHRGQESFFSRLLAEGFYHIFFTLTGMNIKNNTDFKLLNRTVIDAYCALPERKRFFRGLIAWMGFSSAKIFFEVPPRISGCTRWSKFKLFRFSATAISSFSAAPLHLITFLGFTCLGISSIFGSIALYHKLTGIAVSGFTTVILLLLVIGSFNMIGIGLLSFYFEHLFDEIKRRPVYLVDFNKSYLKKG